ncbi:HNH endonuclease signature motif containing protein [Haliea salexigens]|uniref:HNH endonuclease signature motif containing protein n=1 Tax=Haliea salexigens TaxID=287487 RepID=UPI000480D557|nr:HNH endonuclease signature motif containing protein [Haliea salexigens]
MNNLVEILKSRLDYNSQTGNLTWKKTCSPQNKFKGMAAGGIGVNGYIYIGISVNGVPVTLSAHRVVYMISEGVEPQGEIDHINGDRADNRWANLRVVDRLENNKNMAKYKNNSSGVMGVYRNKNNGRWYAAISDTGKRISLGGYGDWMDAVCARKSAENKFGYHQNHGRS